MVAKGRVNYPQGGSYRRAPEHLREITPGRRHVANAVSRARAAHLADPLLRRLARKLPLTPGLPHLQSRVRRLASGAEGPVFTRGMAGAGPTDPSNRC